MTYYRLALQDRQTGKWIWKTTALTSLKAVFQLLRCYRALISQDRIRVFSTSSKEELNELLNRENNGLASGSVTATQFLQERSLLVPERAYTASQQSGPSQAAQPGVATATWARDLWQQNVAMKTAQAIQQEAANITTGTAGSLTMSELDQKRLEIELGPGGDHDVPYSFALPLSLPQTLAWMRLLAKVQRGELEP